jgi:hypothetical protein
MGEFLIQTEQVGTERFQTARQPKALRASDSVRGTSVICRNAIIPHQREHAFQQLRNRAKVRLLLLLWNAQATVGELHDPFFIRGFRSALFQNRRIRRSAASSLHLECVVVQTR